MHYPAFQRWHEYVDEQGLIDGKYICLGLLGLP
jgi:hypothetical protein